MEKRWVSLGLEVGRAERTAARLRKAGVLLSRFETRGAAPDEAADCRALDMLLGKVAREFEQLATAIGCSSFDHLDADHYWVSEDDPDADAAEALEDDTPRDVWQRYPLAADGQPREI